MKKLTLKKDVVARINHDEMVQLKGGVGDYVPTEFTCQSCPACNTVFMTCWGDSCQNVTCAPTCRNTCPPTCPPSCTPTCHDTCPYTCDDKTCANC